ncbi:MAG: ligase-associated DNA damage response DEXH box helicase [Armatimonadota bacterium]
MRPGRIRLENWFRSKGWEPLRHQGETWEAYLARESGLLHSPTGSGKTMAVWGGPLIEAADSQDEERALRVVWVTPLRALAADLAQGLQEAADGTGCGWRVELRTGDTPGSARARQMRSAPHALVTTPESLSLLLSYPESRKLFSGLRLVAVDEWHELLGSRRGVLTELALARLRALSPALRTWGLSATIGNLDEALEALGCGAAARIIRGDLRREIEVDALIPGEMERFPWAGHLGARLLPQVLQAVEEAGSCLIFTNTRAQAETWFRMMVEARPDLADRIGLHHGSLDRAGREEVERGLKEGRLKCVVCTSSLDLGVDFSPVERVLQIGSPRGVARLLQRAGRSGHDPARSSRITCVPTHAFELVETAAARDAVSEGAIEPRRPVRRPLDVLAQHLVTAALGGGFNAEEMYREVRSTRAYRDLPREDWEWTLDFVARGGKALRQYPEYRRLEETDGFYTVTDRRIAKMHRLSVGTIVSDAELVVRYAGGGKLGSVEESFVSRMRPGDRFVFAGRLLELVRVRDGEALVRRTGGSATAIPRWMGGRMPLSSELARAVRRRLEQARDGLYEGPEMEAVRPVLEHQKRISKIPGSAELLIERLRSREGYHLFLYPFEGRLAHEGLAALLAYRISRLQSVTFTLAVNDYGIEMLSACEAPLDRALKEGLLTPARLDEDIAASLNCVEMARRQFREIARVAGLVFQGYPGSPKKLKQLQASSGLLYDVFARYDPDNLLLRQAREEVLDRQLERERMRQALERMERSTVTVLDLDRPSPLGFPLMVERLRERLSSEKLEERIRRMQVQFSAPRRRRKAA